MTDLIAVRKGKPTQVSLADLQSRLDARKEIEETRTATSSRRSRVEEAKRVFGFDPLATLEEIQGHATALAAAFDSTITPADVPLSQGQVNTLSAEFLHLDQLKLQIEALETRYRTLVFAHLDETVTRVPGRPASQTPGKVEADGPGLHYVFERRGGNRANPTLDALGLKNELTPAQIAKVYKTVHHKAVAAYDEDVFDEAAFGELIESGELDLDVVAPYLTAGDWRTPQLYKTLVDSHDHDHFEG